MFELSERRRDELVEQWATRIMARRLGSLAVFMLEAHKPLAPLGAHAVVAFQPLIAALLPIDAHELAAFMNDAGNLERLIRRVEQLQEAEDDAADARRAATPRRGWWRRRR